MTRPGEDGPGARGAREGLPPERPGPAPGTRRRWGRPGGVARWPTSTTRSASRRGPPTRRSRRPTASSRASGTRTPTPGDAQAEERFKEIQEAYSVLSDAGQAHAVRRRRHVRRRARAAAFASTRRSFRGGVGSFGDIISDLFGRGGGGRRRRHRAAGRDLETEVRLSFAQAMSGTRGVGQRARPRRPARPATAAARSPARRPMTCPRCGGRGIETRGPGDVLAVPAVLACAAAAAASIEDPCPTCGGSGFTHQTQALPREDPRRRARGQPHPARRQGRARPRAAAPPATSTWSRASRRHRSSSARATTSRSRCRSRSSRRSRGGTVEVPTLGGTKKIRVPAGTADGSVQRLRGEGPAKLSGGGPRRHPLPLHGRRSPSRSRRSSRRRSTSCPR